MSASGAADSVALRIGNLLVGNPEGTPALEMTLAGGIFGFPEGAIIALAGSDFGAEETARRLPPWTAYPVRPGGTLKTGPTRTGCALLSVCERWHRCEAVFGSASTHVLSGLGGFEGRPLRKGDRLALGPATNVPLQSAALFGSSAR